MTTVVQSKVSLKTPVLKKGANFHLWLSKMTSFLASMDLEYVLDKDFKDKLPQDSKAAIDENKDEGKMLARAKKDNNEAYGFLQQAMDEDKDHLLLLGAQTKEWPHGLAYKGLQKLKQFHARHDLYMAVHRNAKLEAIKLKKGEVLGKLFSQTTLINVKYRDRVDPLPDKEILNLVIRKLPKRYGDGILMEA